MDSSWDWIYCLLSLGSLLTLGRSSCTVPTKIQGHWEVLDSTRTNVETTVEITASGLTGITFWDKTLNYTCFIQSGNYYIFNSATTDLFDLYNVKIYFCWYLVNYSTLQYRLYELTDQVLYTVEERAKAYLNTTTPGVNDVCEIPYDSSLTYKQMQYVVRRSAGISINKSAPVLTAFVIVFSVSFLVQFG